MNSRNREEEELGKIEKWQRWALGRREENSNKSDLVGGGESGESGDERRRERVREKKSVQMVG